MEKPGSPDLTGQFDPISLESSDLASQMRNLADQVEALGAQSQRLGEAQDRGVPLAQLFADELADGAEQLPQAPRQQLKTFLSSMPTSTPDRDRLRQKILLYPAAERNVLLSLLGVMDDEDIAQVYTILADPLYSERLVEVFSIIKPLCNVNLIFTAYVVVIDIHCDLERYKFSLCI